MSKPILKFICLVRIRWSKTEGGRVFPKTGIPPPPHVGSDAVSFTDREAQDKAHLSSLAIVMRLLGQILGASFGGIPVQVRISQRKLLGIRPMVVVSVFLEMVAKMICTSKFS